MRANKYLEKKTNLIFFNVLGPHLRAHINALALMNTTSDTLPTGFNDSVTKWKSILAPYRAELATLVDTLKESDPWYLTAPPELAGPRALHTLGRTLHSMNKELQELVMQD
jgi:hypothetical protein